MLIVVTAVKLVAEVALLALFGQWLLGLLAGAQRRRNVFYRILELVGQPFVRLAGAVSSRRVTEQRRPLLAFFLLLVVWLVATLLKIQLCFAMGVASCR